MTSTFAFLCTAHPMDIKNRIYYSLHAHIRSQRENLNATIFISHGVMLFNSDSEFACQQNTNTKDVCGCVKERERERER